ncbi:protease YdgD [Cribrihabitans marinus]|uniref:Serine protease n=1 Tax=Cribrihabitans marinus TaxID=1227549 RepID=A0A1H7C7W2_9RHOB|nr:trypsin-like peptidase domain-containing protein [Cribrihabitans marinus]GGH33451.1 serine protease [Cribrihabitans marinus]SEJ81725.1 protease YdgD [Cribrihabitans marinus]
MKTLTAFALALVIALPVAAQNSGLRRLTDRDDLFGWEAVGRLNLNGGGICTGTLIAPDLVLTAAHCAFDDATGRHFAPGQVLFQAGLRDGVSVADRKVVQIETPPEFAARGAISTERIRVDIALMRLETPIPTALADPFALHSGDLRGSEVSVSSYGRGRTEAISRQRSCSLLWRDQGLMAFDCNVTFGSSGSAILAREGTRGRILSVVSTGGKIDGRVVGYGMELDGIVDRLKRQMRRDAPAPRASVRRLQAGSGRSTAGAKFVRPGGS